MKHVQVPSTLGHGEWMCLACKATNRELAALGELEECKVSLLFFECRVCDYDSDEANNLIRVATPQEREAVNRAICPLCAGDSGHSNVLTIRPATEKEIEAWQKRSR